MSTKIERRRSVVTLHHGNYEAELAAKMDETMAAQRAEEVGATRRQGTRSQAMQLAKEYDALLTEAEDTATKVTVWAISYAEWSEIADSHPPREDESQDKQRGVNMKTFPNALLRASLVEPRAVVGTIAEHVAALLSEGQSALDALDLSRLHYTKLETAAWNVNVGDDALPKSSLVSLLTRLRDPDSRQQPDSA